MMIDDVCSLFLVRDKRESVKPRRTRHLSERHLLQSAFCRHHSKKNAFCFFQIPPPVSFRAQQTATRTARTKLHADNKQQQAPQPNRNI